LLAGDELISNTGAMLKVRQVRGSPRRETVYNFEVAGDHMYFVGELGVWVHNACETKPDRAFFVDPKGTVIEANRGSVFRANSVTPEIDASISNRGFLTGKTRGVSQERGSALPDDAPLTDRVVQFVEGRPFPRDSNFVGFREIPHDALAIARRTGRNILRQPDASLRLDEVNLDGLRSIDAEAVFKQLGRPPRSPIDVVGEILVEGDVPASRIVRTIKLKE
jgi:hypothetical protein